MMNDIVKIPVTLVAAVTRDGGLGRSGRLLYHISADMKHFKALTMGHPLIMGRKTYESFPSGPLPGRLNIVLTRGDMQLPEGAVVAHTPEEALSIAASYIADKSESDADDKRISAMVIGGGEIYRAFMPVADALEITEIDTLSPSDTDTWFPEIIAAEWNVVTEGAIQSDSRSGAQYRFITYSRRK